MSRKMVDSGIEWIGRIPKDWVLKPLRGCVNEINEKNNHIKFSNVLSLTNTLGVVPYEEKGNQGNISKDDLSQYKLAYKNTIIINSMNLKIGSVGLSNYDGCVSPVYYVLSSKENSNIKFINYLFQSEFQKYLGKFGKGILEIREKISMYDILHSYIPFPSLKEQIKIANYLDDKCSKIDSVIEGNKKEIELLEEYKINIINKYVEPQKDWDNCRIKNVAKLRGRIGWQGLNTNDYINDGPYLVTGTDFSNDSINWESCVHISDERYNEAPEIHIKVGDLLITKDGTIGKLAIIGEDCPKKVSLNSGVLLVRKKKNDIYNNKFLSYILKSNLFLDWYSSSQKGNATIKHLYQEQFSNFGFKMPQVDEQNKIANKLDKISIKIDKIISYRKQIIEKLEEYKKSLIYEVITGKKEV